MDGLRYYIRGLGLRISEVRLPNQFTLQYKSGIVLFTYYDKGNVFFVNVKVTEEQKGQLSEFSCPYENHLNDGYFNLESSSLFMLSAASDKRANVKKFLTILYN